jgi:Peptidase C13 family
MKTKFKNPSLVIAVVLFLLLVHGIIYLTGCVISPQRAQWRDKSNALLAEQQRSAERLQTVSGTKKVIYAAFALDSSSQAFQGDAILVRDALRSINPQISVLLLSNQLEYSDIVYPFATKENVKNVLSEIARLADKNTIVVLLFSSHGFRNLLSIKIGHGDASDRLTGKELRSYLEGLRPVPTVLIISACYSGSFVPELASENRIIITSASRDRPSFGCSFESQATYFVQEFFQNSFDPSLSLAGFFSQGQKRIADREGKEKRTPSEPQIFVGERMKKLASIPLRNLLVRNGEKP